MAKFSQADDPDFAFHLSTYRSFLRGVMLSAAVAAGTLVLLALFVL